MNCAPWTIEHVQTCNCKNVRYIRTFPTQEKKFAGAVYATRQRFIEYCKEQWHYFDTSFLKVQARETFVLFDLDNKEIPPFSIFFKKKHNLAMNLQPLSSARREPFPSFRFEDVLNLALQDFVQGAAAPVSLHLEGTWSVGYYYSIWNSGDPKEKVPFSITFFTHVWNLFCLGIL